MADIRIVSKADLRETVADWLLLKTGLIDERDELANLVKVALMTDRLSAPHEIRPDPDSDDRRGWWGDMDAENIWNGWPIGTKNWLLTRAKISDKYSWEGDTVVRAENYTREAVAPLVERKMASHVEVVARRTAIDKIDVRVIVSRGPDRDVELLFQDMWNQLREETPADPYGVGY
jgi:phage gp46-like protein